jgi:hypothetical protein
MSACRSLLVATCLALTGACFAPAYVEPRVDYLPTSDSSIYAYESGRRDALYDQGSWGPRLLQGLAYPALIIAGRNSADLKTILVASATVSVGIAGWSYHKVLSPLPAPRDSTLVRNRFRSEALWNRYVEGYQEAMLKRRQREFTVHATTAAIAVAWAIAFWPSSRYGY